MKILVIAEHDNKVLNPATMHIISAAQKIGSNIDVLVAGADCQAVVDQAKNYGTQVLHADHLAYQYFLAENMAALIQSLAQDYAYILAPATTFGKNILPRVAALLDSEQISEIIAVIDPQTFVRPIYAGNAIATVKTTAPKILLTVRPTAFELCQSNSQPAPATKINAVFDLKLSEFVQLNATNNSELPDLASARVIIAGGRGLQSKENFALLEKLAHKLNAAIGASRAAVDAGFVPNDLQIGQTGKVVAPELYIAVGISGAIQHLAGMKDSKVIVAINQDPDAPIFQVADYGLVGDLFTLIPEFTAAISAKS